MAAPPVVAQPMQLTPASAPPAEATPEAQEPELRGESPLPEDLTLVPAPPAETPQEAAQQATAPAAPPTPAQNAEAPAAQQAEAPPEPPRPTASLSVGEREDFTRLVFRFDGPATVTPLLRNDRLDLRFSRAADIDLAEVRANLPRFVREVRRVSAAGHPVRLQITLEAGVRQRHFVDGERVVVDLLPPERAPQRTETAAQEPAVQATAPVRGNARVELVEEADITRIMVTWPQPARAAAFRRGEAIWLLFDATGRIDLGNIARVGQRHRDVQVVQGDGVTGLRIPAPPEVLVSAAPSRNGWVFTLGPRADSTNAAPLTRELTPDGRGRLAAAFQREGVVRWIRDPEIGDTIGVALIGGSPLGVQSRRATVEAAVLPSAHGAVVEPRADGVTASFEAGVLTVTRGEGLITAAPATELEANLRAALVERALSTAPPAQQGPNLVEVRQRIDELNRRAAEEGTEEGAPVEARLELARYLLENEFAAEALGALRTAAVNQGDLIEADAEFRLMRGAANVMMGRVSDALLDLNASLLRDHPSAALWRGYAASLQQNWADARRELERGASALEDHPAAWRARFQLALARSAFELNDFAASEAAARAVSAQTADPVLRMRARLIEARLAATRGDSAGALAMFEEVARGPDEESAVRAILESIRVQRAMGAIQPGPAIEALEALRYRWRGDSTEIAIVGVLGEVYSEIGRWRDALATMRIAADRYPADPRSRQLRADMTTLFERLFLDGEADRLEPIQALGLFYEFSDLTPVGPNGDRIVRLLAGRLVHVDLLEQAAQLLQHQVDERLEGLSKAQAAADLAAIYLMDHRPDRALSALAASRQPNTPAALQANRRMLEARALLDLGRLENAVEMVDRDRSEDAQRVRAEAAWRSRDWLRAAAELRALLAMRNRAQPLDADSRQTVLRLGVALTLAGDDPGVRALYREYAGDLANTPEADAFEVIASGVHADGAAIRDVARAIARTDLLDRFMQGLRTRMTEEAATTPARATVPAPQSPVPQAGARPPQAAPGAGA